MSPLPLSLRGATPGRIDLAVALAVALALMTEAFSGGSVRGWNIVLAALAGALLATPVALRRRSPAVALVCGAAIAALQAPLSSELGATGGTATLLALVLLSYSAGAWLELRPALLSLVLAAMLFLVYIAEIETLSAAALPGLFVLAAPWLLGRTVRERTRRAGAFRALALQTEREQAESERAAIARERLRIGVELQDIIAHSVSAMAIQAAAARGVLRSDPELARETIFTVEQTGRQALGDLRRLLGMLRHEDDPRMLAPQPGLSQVTALLEAMGARGLACELHGDCASIELTPGVDLVGYRVIECALNCAAARGGTRARIELNALRDGLLLAVSSDAPSPRGDEELRAIAERVALYGGRLELLGAHGGELDVRVTLPLTAARGAA